MRQETKKHKKKAHPWMGFLYKILKLEIDSQGCIPGCAETEPYEVLIINSLPVWITLIFQMYRGIGFCNIKRVEYIVHIHSE